MLNNLFIFAGSFFLVIKGATLATRYAARFAESYQISKYTVGFIVVAIVSILPETFISINSALKGIPSFGLGMLFGSNIADLTLVFALIILATGRGLKIESKILKNHYVYPFILFLPIVLGLDGYFSRLEGIVLIIVGAVFYYVALKQDNTHNLHVHTGGGSRLKNFSLLVLSMVILLVGAYFTVTSATELAGWLNVSPILIGILIVGLGTTMPELFFSLNSAKKEEDSLAVGDILGTVLADATIVVGVLALIHPFVFPKNIIYVTGTFMLVVSVILFHFMRTGRNLSKREALALLYIWIIFVIVEFLTNKLLVP